MLILVVDCRSSKTHPMSSEDSFTYNRNGLLPHNPLLRRGRKLKFESELNNSTILPSIPCDIIEATESLFTLFQPF